MTVGVGIPRPTVRLVTVNSPLYVAEYRGIRPYRTATGGLKTAAFSEELGVQLSRWALIEDFVFKVKVGTVAQCLVIPMPFSRTGLASTSVIDSPAARFPRSGTPLAHQNRPPLHPRAVAGLDLLMASQCIFGP